MGTETKQIAMDETGKKLNHIAMQFCSSTGKYQAEWREKLSFLNKSKSHPFFSWEPFAWSGCFAAKLKEQNSIIWHLGALLCQKNLGNRNFCYHSPSYSAPLFGIHYLLLPLFYFFTGWTRISPGDTHLCFLLWDLTHYRDNTQAFSCN